MTRAATLVELGERYAALGLMHAAKATWTRALASADDAAAGAAYRLAELALATGNPQSGREHAREAVRREPGPSARLLLGRAQLAAGEVAAARLSFTSAIEAAAQMPRLRAFAHLGLAKAAAQSGDRPGADANTMAAVAALCELAKPAGHEAVAAELAFVQELFAHAAGAGLAEDAQRYLNELAEAAPHAPVALLRGLLLAAAQSHGDSAVADREIEGALADAIAQHPARPVRILAIERRLRRRYRDSAARDQSIAELRALMVGDELGDERGASPPSLAGNIEMARLSLLLADVYAEDPARAAEAEALYRASIAAWPGHRAAAGRLAALLAARRPGEEALAAVERALLMDAEHKPAWHSAALMLKAAGTDPIEPMLGRILEAAAPGAGQAAEPCAKLVAAVAEAARQSALDSLSSRGHRLKNVLGILGARARSARKAASADLADRLGELEGEITALYEEWATYLLAMQESEATWTGSPVMEIVLVHVLVSEVVEAAAATASVPIALRLAPVPDLRGDRLLLRDALVNLVTNAAQAAAQTAGSVEVTVRPAPRAAPPCVEIEIADTGPGISRADLARLFVPGFTTKSTGSGVGLTVAERVISAHRGRIAVDSEEGRGTRITVVLPIDLLDFAAVAGSWLGSTKLG